MIPDTICGHDRNALRKALEFANASSLDEISRGWPRPDAGVGALLFDVHDPAKLAAIIVKLAVEGGRFGLVDYASVAELDDDMHTIGAYPWHPSTVSIHIQYMDVDRTFTLNMPQARAFALALLDAPNATALDVERMIGEATQ
jgi:hypothetical protein